MILSPAPGTSLKEDRDTLHQLAAQTGFTFPFWQLRNGEELGRRWLLIKRCKGRSLEI